MKKYTFVILSIIAVLSVLGAMFAEVTPTATVGAEKAHTLPMNERTKDDAANKATVTVDLPTFNTGECGYLHEQGMIHRNEFITPSFCFHDNGDAPTVNQVTKKHSKQDKNVTVITIDNGGVDPSNDKPAPSDDGDKTPEKSCHNKNDDKDNRDGDCNAGRGNDDK